MGKRLVFKKGTKINNLTVIQPSSYRSASGGIKWECICDCGNTCYVEGTRLKNHRAKSCGCLSKQALKDGREKYKIVDKTGRKYGRLTVLERDFDKEKERKHGVYWKCICECGEQTTVSSDNLRNDQFSTQSCGKCRSSHGQNKIRNLLRENHIEFIEEYRFLDCRNQRPLPFDFYLPKYNCCIEFDGKQHFTETGGWNTKENVKIVQNNDKIKNQYCINKNIKLIRIPYFEYDNIHISELIPESSRFLIN